MVVNPFFRAIAFVGVSINLGRESLETNGRGRIIFFYPVVFGYYFDAFPDGSSVFQLAFFSTAVSSMVYQGWTYCAFGYAYDGIPGRTNGL